MSENTQDSFARKLKNRDLVGAGQDLITFVLDRGVNGTGPFKSAEAVAEECLKHAGGDREAAIRRVTRLHSRNVGVAGFALGFGGAAAMPATIPTDITVFYVQAARMVASIAYLRGYDPTSDEVRSAIALSLLGAAGAEVLKDTGVNIAGKAGVAALKKMPADVLKAINKKVGFRLLTKFGEKGAVNLIKVVPVLAAGVGAGLNTSSMLGISTFSKINFPAIHNVDSPAAAEVLTVGNDH